MICLRWFLMGALIAGSYGLSVAPAAERVVIEVSADGTGDYTTIGEAVSNAPAGATVRISEGTWKDPVTITKPLTLEGAGWDQTRIHVEFAGVESLTPDQNRELEEIYQQQDQENVKRLFHEFAQRIGWAPAIKTQGTDDVFIRNIAALRSEPVKSGGFSSLPTVEIQDAAVQLDGCAILESPGIGVTIGGNSRARLTDCLVANAWGTGISINISDQGSVEIADSDIRNNVYSGVGIKSPSKSISVKRCRISGTGWHGIRYDNSAPSITGNVFRETAVSGIYASGRTGATVKHNLFYKSGFSCWFQNADTIESNTFIGNRESRMSGGLQLLGASQPVVRRNLFVDCRIAVKLGTINSKKQFSESPGKFTLIENAFWNNDRNLSLPDDDNREGKGSPLPEGNLQEQPEFSDVEADNLRLKQGSALADQNIGAEDFVEFKSPWPEQPEEARTIAEVAKRLQQTAAQQH